MSYVMISVSALLFSLVFVFSDRFRARYGEATDTVLQFTAGAHAAGCAALLVINRFRPEWTPFTLLAAGLAAVDLILFQLCSLRALGRTNLSKDSVFSMIGGMARPFLAGILFFHEPLAPGKLLCLLLVGASVVCTMERADTEGGRGYYLGVFLTNGLYGVICKWFSAATFPKTSEAGFSVLVEGFTVLLALLLLPFAKPRTGPVRGKGLLHMGAYGLFCAVGNYLLLLALRTLPATAQYPFVTGGVMILSTVYSCFSSQKPGKRELIAVLLALLGIAALLLL